MTGKTPTLWHLNSVNEKNEISWQSEPDNRICNTVRFGISILNLFVFFAFLSVGAHYRADHRTVKSLAAIVAVIAWIGYTMATRSKHVSRMHECF